MFGRNTVLVALVGLFVSLGCWQLLTPIHDTWGTYYSPHAQEKYLALSNKQHYKQTFLPEYSAIGGLLIQLRDEAYADDDGLLTIQIRQKDKMVETRVPVSSTLVDGFVAVDFPSPLFVDRETPADILIGLADTDKTLQLQYQQDSSKFEQGALFYSNSPNKEASISKAGHLSFRIEYRASSIERIDLSLGATLLLLSLGVGGILLLPKVRVSDFKNPIPITGSEVFVVLISAIGLTLLFGWHLLPLQSLPVNADMSKDIIYTQTTVSALRSGQAPVWQHATCGGQPLLGNPETPVLTIAPLLGLLFGAVAGFKLFLLMEVFVAVLGMYVLGRVLGLRHLGSLVAAILLPLTGFIVNRFFIGHTMFIGGIAIMPWLLSAGYSSLYFHKRWMPVTAILGVFMFFRGDTHVVLYSFIALGIFATVKGIRNRSMRPLVIIGIISFSMIALSSIKWLPVIEGKEHFRGENLPELVIPLVRSDQLFNVFLDNSTESKLVDVLNGELEGWENIGAYIGPVVLLLAALGAAVSPRREIRISLLAVLGATLILGEGSLYEESLRTVPYLGQVFRLPSRILLISVVSCLILCGIGIDFINRLTLKSARIFVMMGILLLIFYDVGGYAVRTLGRMEFVMTGRLDEALSTEAREGDTTRFETHPITLAASGHVSPGSCQDFNQSPPFETTGTHPLISSENGEAIQNDIRNGSITFQNMRTPSTVTARIVDSPMINIVGGIPYPEIDQIDAFDVIGTGNQTNIDYRSALLLPGLLFWLGSCLLLGTKLSMSKAQDSI